MTCLFTLALLLAQSPAEPDRLEFRTEKAYLIGGLPTSLTIVALDQRGNPLASFAGPVEVEGLVGIRQGKRVALTTTGLFSDGTATVDNISLSGESARFRWGTRTQTWSPRIIPGWLTVVPALIAIGLAIASRQVLMALFAGVWTGLVIVLEYDPLSALLRALDTSVIESVADNAPVIVFTLALGGMVGVISRSGGMRALADAISSWAHSRRSGMLSSILMGIVIFFDDYANCLLVGSTLRPFTDTKRISREKLAFLVDSTAAPVAGLMFISTWIGVELQYMISSGLVSDATVYATFLKTIPYRFYNILMLVFVLAVALSRRDFGPMLQAERRALLEGKLLRPGAQPLTDNELTRLNQVEGKVHWLNGVVPIAALIFIVFAGLYWSGSASLLANRDALAEGLAAGSLTANEISDLKAMIEGGVLANADSYAALLWASFGGGIMAVALSIFTGCLSLKESVDAWVAGARSMLMATLILVLAWSLGSVVREQLSAGQWIATWLRPSAGWMPLMVFVVSCLIAFSTGTSFGTMAIVFPIAGPMLLAASGGDAASVPECLKLATLSAVMSGAVFGDHCSPISDTTIMSSIGAGSDHTDHVRTQAPYALSVAAVAAIAGYIPAGFGMPVWISLLLGAGAVVGLLYAFGRQADDASG